ncbi:proline dehydrogenase family protein [Leeuwenhoekiella palythoae]|uniref:L-proline dehydrogenase n=1 Tax=Leeuwenhoekiella palythoae TaxID=573501 RepID=A0A1M5XSX9_9FLAO|nr:proline dehydrogenase family protein [Leeuwenhoekiella palythoae]MAS20425.1 proline dehydrogenase [Leeuwenhoekiella sp.]MEC7784910.1 proline dehydrogenase family protein [Bacteroidota bacterium]MEE3146811.1 proline dehydrogenase family protein [Bacteroidota bacterium]RXG30212.1 L-proline dehydrogenase [Leeuwenhoekiella palythoae]SHI02363.1 L-proline dehydrogenase [Leeuwenhoekiella palythoae]|tara:strand:- start:316 stop:1491 length:1176 start_codon:yes stop_codon:yes gene_type:complete
MLEQKIFDDTKTAFSLKSDSELERAYFLFKMISLQPLVKIGTAVTRFALNASLPVEGLVRATVFDHFCGGVSEKDCVSTIDAMYSKNVHSVLDFSVEGKETESLFDSALERVMSLIDFAKDRPGMPFSVFKPTGFGRFEVWRKVTENETLSDKEQQEWKRIQERFHKVCKKAKACDIKLLIDAEESWMQGAVDDLVLEMMQTYNQEKPIVFTTLQCYRWDRLAYLKDLHQDGIEKGYHLGIKIVRGAYMEKERARAEEKGYDSPICKDKPETDAHFNAMLVYIFDNLEDIWAFIGTHNEESNYLAIEIMAQKEIAPDDGRVWFGQLYGMSDHISYNLAKEGYNVTKYVPFGPVKDVMPYLIRRAEENTSVAGQTNRELSLIQEERRRRKLN